MRKFALVLDAPVTGRGPWNGPPGELMGALIRAVITAAGGTPPTPARMSDLVDVFYVVDAPTPGGKPPKIKEIRAEQPRLIAELAAADPLFVLSAGTAGATALGGATKVLPISKNRGRMRWLELPGPDGGEVTRVPWTPTISPGAVIRSSDLYRDLQNDVWKAWTQLAPLPETTITYLSYADIQQRAQEI